MNKKGLENIIIVTIIGIFIVLGGAYVIVKHSGQPSAPEQKLQNQQSGVQSPTPAVQLSTPPLECVGLKATDSNLPESCKIWFSVPQKTQPEKIQPQQLPQQKTSLPQNNPVGSNGDLLNQDISVKSTSAKYKTVSSKPTSGWFQTGQDADIMLSGIDFNNTGGPLLFNHPGTVASDGAHLFLTDRNNNRVLIWNQLPNDNVPPDLVLGQQDFNSNNPGTEIDQMNWPVSVSAANGKVVVTDTNNNRILIWNSFPTKNGQSADIVINSVQGDAQQLQANPKRNIQWPWGVWTDGKKLAVASTRSELVLLWNSFPTQNDQPADLYLQGQMGTPRSIASDGNHIMVGDHNAFGSPSKPSKMGNFFWETWPNADNATSDFFMPDPSDSGVWMNGAFMSDGKFITIGGALNIWSAFPKSAQDIPFLTVGRSAPVPPGQSFSGYRFLTGDGAGLVSVQGKIYILGSSGNKIVVYNSLPVTASQIPDFAIGSPSVDINTLDTNFIMSNSFPLTDGKSLFVASDVDNKLYIFKNLPDQSNSHPDIVYDFSNVRFEPLGGGVTYNGALALAGHKDVYLWKKLPLNGELPDLHFKNRIGNVTFQDILGVAMDDQYFYLSDGWSNKIYVWAGIPSINSNPKFVISVDQPWRLSSDGNYLVVTATLSASANNLVGPVKIYRISNLSSNSQPVATVGGPAKFNFQVSLPQDSLVYQGHLFIGDTGFNRVLIWKNIEDAIAGKDADVILGTVNSTIPNAPSAIGRNKLFMPATLAFDGSFLWVGEFKFSERLLRFSIKP